MKQQFPRKCWALSYGQYYNVTCVRVSVCVCVCVCLCVCVCVCVCHVIYGHAFSEVIKNEFKVYVEAAYKIIAKLRII